MLRSLGDEGYTIEWRVVNSAEYGFPQRRIRVFIVARLDYFIDDPEAYLVSEGILARGLPATGLGEISKVQIDNDVVRITKEFNKGGKSSPFLSGGVYIDGVAYTQKVSATWEGPRRVLKDVLIPDNLVPTEYWVSEDQLPQWEYLKGAKTIKRTHTESGAEYNYSEGKMAFPDDQNNPSRTILTGEGGTSPSRFKHIIKRPRGYRRLTPVELERLNGFDDGWTAVGKDGTRISDARRAFFMGNALVIGLIERVGAVLASEIKRT